MSNIGSPSLHVEQSGHGPPLVLLHGWAMHGGVFAGWLARLREHHSVYLVDLPGYGCSRESTVPLQLDAVVAAIQTHVGQPAQWCGWSLGGLFALHAALAYPQQVTRLVMLCATPCFVRRPDWPQAVSGEIFDDFAHGLRQDYPGTLERFVALEAFGSDHAREEIRTLRQQLFARGEPPADALTQGLHLLHHTDLRAGLPQLCMPSLWLAGRRDRLVPPKAVAMAAAMAPQAQYHVIEQAGHAPFLTHADVLMRHWYQTAAV